MIPSSQEMNAPDGQGQKSGAMRWARIAALGFVLGLVFVFVNLVMWSLMGVRDKGDRRASQFKLSKDTTRRELARVVGSQLTAFRNNDFSGAYTFATTELRAKMTTNAFAEMVKTGYPAIARSRDAEVGVMLDNGDEALVDVAVADDSGKVMHYRYLMLHEEAGWKIGGVMKVRMQGTVL